MKTTNNYEKQHYLMKKRDQYHYEISPILWKTSRILWNHPTHEKL